MVFKRKEVSVRHCCARRALMEPVPMSLRMEAKKDRAARRKNQSLKP